MRKCRRITQIDANNPREIVPPLSGLWRFMKPNPGRRSRSGSALGFILLGFQLDRGAVDLLLQFVGVLAESMDVAEDVRDAGHDEIPKTQSINENRRPFGRRCRVRLAAEHAVEEALELAAADRVL